MGEKTNSSLSFRKYILNHIVIILFGLPNLAINVATQTVLDVGFHWSGFYAVLAYLIGLGFSIEFSVLFNIFTKSNFRLGKWSWSYGKMD